MNIALPTRKVGDFRARVAESTAVRQSATVREVLVLEGKLHHASFVIRPGRYFVRRLLQISNLYLSEAERAAGGAWGRYRKRTEARRGLRLPREFMADVRWWGWFLGRGRGYGGERITAPFFRFVKQRPSRTWLSNASLAAIGGLFMEMGVCWRFDLPEEMQKRTVEGGRAVADLICIKLLEVMAMVMTAYVIITMKRERPRRRGEAVLTRADNGAAVTWVRRRGGGGEKQARVGALMRIMGAMEAKGGWCLQARHVRVVDNRMADGLTRWKEGQILEKGNAEYPGIAWQVEELGTGEQLMC